jgi:hypothetical protein
LPASDPIGFSTGSDGSSLTGEVYVPTKLVAGITAAVNKLRPHQQMTPAGGNGGNL